MTTKRFTLSRKHFLGCGLGGVALALWGCTAAESPPSPSDKPTPVVLNGAGATFPAPIYQRWFQEYNRIHPEVQISYQPVGSAAGVRQFVVETVDFGASDVAMTAAEAKDLTRPFLMLPMTAGTIVLAFNLPGIKELNLRRSVYVDIFLGAITRWNDPAIAQDNPDLSLPDQEILLVYRSDGSGTTALFTKHLSLVSETWRNGPGEGFSIQWPTGFGARGNEGVTAQIAQAPGTLGYVEYVYAKQNRLTIALLENKAGEFVAATPEQTSRTLASVVLPENLVGFDLDPKGKDVYPIVSYTWLLLYQKYANARQAEVLREVLNWILSEGQKLSTDLGFIPLPPETVAKIEPLIATISA
ncbi:MAG: phosphate ABC transporter substrate-binding protein PstS [Oscillatoriales cyanobacterium SM2_2_1]|nr:phosphate ABC transporter substrate-binding protein PstS [Oscillatoriales cyanobacterium SM2_2_1]